MKTAMFIFPLLLAVSCIFGEDLRLGPKDGLDLPSVDLERVRPGISAPDFTLESMDGNPVTLSGFRSKNKVVLVFYRGSGDPTASPSSES
jgi:cytochrome oxidase Cu insertion factor (SCO1/SenC/PrrC family)